MHTWRMSTKYGYCLYYLHHPRQGLIILSFYYYNIISVWGLCKLCPRISQELTVKFQKKAVGFASKTTSVACLLETSDRKLWIDFTSSTIGRPLDQVINSCVLLQIGNESRYSSRNNNNNNNNNNFIYPRLNHQARRTTL